MPGAYSLPDSSPVIPANRTADMGLSSSASASGGITYNITYNRGTQDRESILADVQSLQILYGGQV